MRNPEPVAQDAQTLTTVLRALEAQGYGGQFKVLEFGSVQCLTCRREYKVETATIDSIRRLEGVSDPSDMLAVAALTCPQCDALGTLVLSYGPDSSLEDAQVLASLPDVAREGEVDDTLR
jgi:hypothetical protein